jgi:hypothetical protein
MRNSWPSTRIFTSYGNTIAFTADTADTADHTVAIWTLCSIFAVLLPTSDERRHSLYQSTVR